MMKVWINRKVVPADQARISVSDRGFLYGDGVFETMRGYAGVIYRLDEHIARLFGSLKTARIRLPYSKTYLKEAVRRIVELNALRSAYVRLTATRGEGRFGLSYKDKFRPNVVIVAKEFGEYPDRMYRSGISAWVSDIRQNEKSPVSNIKSLNFLGNILARFEAKKRGFDEAILANTEGHIAEAATSNIFLVKGGALFTPSAGSGILPGVTRAVVLDIADRLRIYVKERHVSRRDLLSADEVFLTNSLIEILPVTRIDSRKIGAGRVGELTKLLRISYQKDVIREVSLR